MPLRLWTGSRQAPGGFPAVRALGGLGGCMSVLKVDGHEDAKLWLCVILWGFLGQVTSRRFSEAASGRL